ncbi:iron-containing alcohol dehydrogenase [uncultured Desulfosarcina sp.]|uniref:iron-containing alcohol dehydrogenase n=1 Tax=uncultured Desulfosarcina sp. TaxID=218289 RepID=UPI0029C8B4B0|nr:iron-containing alcohol dehydrogenase [uncultured Desulfosarcina sp.]
MLLHAVEAYTCFAKKPLSDAHALLAIELIGQNLLSVINEPDNADGHLALAVGATLAGMVTLWSCPIHGRERPWIGTTLKKVAFKFNDHW